MKNKFKDGMVTVGLVFLFVLLLLCFLISIYQESLPVLTIKVQDVMIRQEESLPEIRVTTLFTGNKTQLLSKEKNYTVGNLMEDLSCGRGYSVKSDLDQQIEGTYTLQLDFDENLKEMRMWKWNYKIRIQVEHGQVMVLNKYGDWQGNRFRLLDGTYAVGWMDLGDGTYYFDSNEEKVTGEKEISGRTYYFLQDGKLDMERNTIDPTKPMLALTFDDGPGPYTMELVRALEKHNARATFFLIGKKVLERPEVVREMDRIGCEIGNHSTNHIQLTKCNAEEIAYEIDTTDVYIQTIINKQVSLVRTPYGSTNQLVRDTIKAPIIHWSVDPRDWEVLDSEAVKQHVLEKAKDGEIILLHDVHETTVQAAIELIPILIKEGYQLVTVSELAQIRGITLQNGNVYHSFK